MMRSQTTSWFSACILAATLLGCESAESERAADGTPINVEALTARLQRQATPADPTANPPAGGPETERVASGSPPSAASPTPRSDGMERYPLRADGTPDFEKYVLTLYRQGVTPDNNAAVLMWQVLWPEEQNLLSPDQKDEVVVDGRTQSVADYLQDKHGRFYQELGLPGVPAKADVLRSESGAASRKRVEAWMRARGGRRSAAPQGTYTGLSTNDPYTLIGGANSHPWTTATIPPLAEWIRENERALDHIVVATKRPRYYAPYPDLLTEQDDPLVTWLLPHAQELRGVARGLSTRAMWHLGEGRRDAAWQDILTMHRLARLVGQQLTFIEQLVAVAIDSMAATATVQLLDDRQLTAVEARGIEQSLSELAPFSRGPDAFDSFERAVLLDVVLRMKSGRTAVPGLGDLLDFVDNIGVGSPGQDKTYLNDLRAAAKQVTDWNLVLGHCNDFYDHFVRVCRMPAGSARNEAIAQLEAELDQSIGQQLRSIASLSPEQRSFVFGWAMIEFLAPSVQSAMAVLGRGNTVPEMVRVAAAIAAFRAEQGRYPDALSELSSATASQPPVDALTGQALVYRRDGEGYLLYSLGANGVDDGGVGPYAIAGDTSGAGGAAKQGGNSTAARRPGDDISLRLPLAKYDWSNVLSQ